MHMLLFISHLSPTHTDDAVDAAACIVEEGHGDGVFARRQPVAFGGRVNLENMSSGAEDRLLPLKHNKADKLDVTEELVQEFPKFPCRRLQMDASTPVHDHVKIERRA